MRAYLKFIKVWHIIETGWTFLDIEIADWTTEEKSVAMTNDKALNAIFIFVSHEEFSRVSRCEIAKQAWETLEITHEFICLFLNLKRLECWKMKRLMNSTQSLVSLETLLPI
jgi:hypothetical protein